MATGAIRGIGGASSLGLRGGERSRGHGGLLAGELNHAVGSGQRQYQYKLFLHGFLLSTPRTTLRCALERVATSSASPTECRPRVSQYKSARKDHPSSGAPFAWRSGPSIR